MSTGIGRPSGSMVDTALPPVGPTDRSIEDCVLSSPRSTATPDAPAPPSTPARTGTAAPDELVVEIHGVRRTVLQALRLFGETVVVPTLLVTVLLPFTNLFVALGAALGWCYLAVLVRWIRGHRLPGTMMLCVSMLSGKACLALATGSAFVYLLQPALGSALMALLFLGSALLGRPVTMRLARDFVHLPQHVLARRPVRTMFVQVALLWGAGRLLDAVMSVAFLHWSVDAGLLSRGVLSPMLTVLTVAACTLWGWRAMRRAGVTFRLSPAPAA
jgi:hypothetical protein